MSGLPVNAARRCTSRAQQRAFYNPCPLVLSRAAARSHFQQPRQHVNTDFSYCPPSRCTGVPKKGPTFADGYFITSLFSWLHRDPQNSKGQPSRRPLFRHFFSSLRRVPKILKADLRGWRHVTPGSPKWARSTFVVIKNRPSRPSQFLWQSPQKTKTRNKSRSIYNSVTVEANGHHYQ